MTVAVNITCSKRLHVTLWMVEVQDCRHTLWGYTRGKKYRALSVFTGCVKSPIKGKLLSYFSKAGFLYLGCCIIAEKRQRKRSGTRLSPVTCYVPDQGGREPTLSACLLNTSADYSMR